MDDVFFIEGKIELMVYWKAFLAVVLFSSDDEFCDATYESV
jgi:hypothetical protein